MAVKNGSLEVSDLKASAFAYKNLLRKAIKCASPSDAITLQKIGTGLVALTRVLKAIEEAGMDGKSYCSTISTPLE